MIDTNELRKIANNTDLHGSKIYCSSIALWMEAVADELDRLYEIERRNTPLTREEIEAELVRRGFAVAHNLEIETVYRKDWSFDNVRIFLDGAVSVHGENDSFQLHSVTLALLDTVLGAK